MVMNWKIQQQNREIFIDGVVVLKAATIASSKSYGLEKTTFTFCNYNRDNLAVSL
jgi:hypothetical protein